MPMLEVEMFVFAALSPTFCTGPWPLYILYRASQGLQNLELRHNYIMNATLRPNIY